MEIEKKTKKQIKYEFGISIEDGKVLHISEISQRGKACNCICPFCGKALEAKLGKGGRIRHFAHSKEESLTCNEYYANESGLHKLAKQIFTENDHIVLPKFYLEGKKDDNCNIFDHRQVEKFYCSDEYNFEYKDVVLEKRFSDFAPDIILSSGNHAIYVEIAVKHFVDDEKKSVIRENNISCIEIDISDFYNSEVEFSRDKLEKKLIEETDRKSWIYNRHEERGLLKLKERNEKFEKEYQENRKQEEIKRKKKEENRIEWIKKQKLLKERIENDLEEIKKDNIKYASIVNELENREESNEYFKQTAFFDEAKKLYRGIPFFCNIPVFGEIAFTCDRRIWQMMLFNNFFYKRKDGYVEWKKIYCYFYRHCQELLNDKWVYKQNKNIKFYNLKDLLGEAISEYLAHLSALGFIEHSIYTDGVSDEYYYEFEKHTIVPPRKKAGRVLKSALAEYEITTNPWEVLHRKISKKIEEEKRKDQ